VVSIVKANEQHAQLLTELARLTFLESHGHSATKEDIDKYVAEKYTEPVLKTELQNQDNIYHILYENNKPAGFSKILLNSPYENAGRKNISKLERIYFLQAFYNAGYGQQLFDYNIKLIKENNQAGVWLYVWKENPRAVAFYKKNGFVITGNYDFKISETHSNPNHQMLLIF
jgi:ribosomal protein S18 acetylase RimI-like enzyme